MSICSTNPPQQMHHINTIDFKCLFHFMFNHVCGEGLPIRK